MKASQEERSKLVRKIMYDLFNTKSAFEMVKSKEKYIKLWYNELREVLEPKIIGLPECKQQKIISDLLIEETKRNENKELKELLERFMGMVKV